MEPPLPVKEAGSVRTVKELKLRQKQSRNRHRNGWWDVWKISSELTSVANKLSAQLSEP